MISVLRCGLIWSNNQHLSLFSSLFLFFNSLFYPEVLLVSYWTCILTPRSSCISMRLHPSFLLLHCLNTHRHYIEARSCACAAFFSFPHCHEGPTFYDRLHRHYVYIFLNYTPITLALQTTPKASQVCNNFAKPTVVMV